ncbi:hypothetical protein BH09DEP1_BH09DEP1_5660 [soil metagenome]
MRSTLNCIFSVNRLFLWAALFAALSAHSMHVSSGSGDEGKPAVPPKNVEMKNFAAKPPARIPDDSSSFVEGKEYNPICFGNMNKKPTGLYSHVYTLASVEKKNQGKSS